MTFNRISKAVANCIPTFKQSSGDFNVLDGILTLVKSMMQLGKPIYVGVTVVNPSLVFYFDNMKRTRAVFKLALRYCMNHVEELKADVCAESLFDKDPRKFWKKCLQYE